MSKREKPCRDYLWRQHLACHLCHGDGGYEHANPDNWLTLTPCVECAGIRRVLGLPEFRGQLLRPLCRN